MAKVSLMAGTSNYITHIFIQSASSITGAGLSGLTALSTGLTAYFKRNTSPTSTAISLTGTGILGSYTSGLFKEIDSVNMSGWYELHLPNSVLAVGAHSVGVHLQGAVGMVPVPLEIELTAINNQDNMRMGIMALPATAAASAGGLPTADSNNAVLVQSGTGSGQLSLVSGTVTVGTNNDKSGYALAPSQSFSTSGSVGSVTGSVGTVTGPVLVQSGTGSGQLSLVNGTVTVGTNNDKSGYALAPSQSFSTSGSVGSVTGSVGTVTGPVLVQSGTGSGQLSLVNGTVTVGTNNDKSGYALAPSQSFSTSGSVGQVAGNVTGSVGALSPVAQSNVATAVWDEPQQKHLIAGTTGFNLSVAGTNPDPWSANLSVYPNGTAGHLVVQNLDTTVSSRSNLAAADVWNVASRSLTDKSGFVLDPSGVDSIIVESGVNARQAFSAILASAAGVLSGAESGPITILGGNVATKRIVATVDSFGNRSSVTLTLPS